jgi:putative peptidoglycan lipid II flippase
VALMVLALPVVTLLYEHGAFTANDTTQTARAIQFYLLGTTFAAIDQPLVFAFYARKNTLLPNLVAVVGLGIYLVVALALIQPLGFVGLVLANSAQLAGHALVMLFFTQRRTRWRGAGVDDPEIGGSERGDGRGHVSCAGIGPTGGLDSKDWGGACARADWGRRVYCRAQIAARARARPNVGRGARAFGASAFVIGALAF